MSLTGLNDAQNEAVTTCPSQALQVIAGPGTGKTKVLVLRVAFLLLQCKIPPQNVIVTTFTKKAAIEMKERLARLLENTSIDINKLLIGTFHSICFRLLRAYGKLVDLVNPRIATEQDSNFILKETVEKKVPGSWEFADDDVRNFKKSIGDDFDIKLIKREISKLKSLGYSSESYAASNRKDKNKFISLVFSLYNEKLRNENLLDFDDCLVECLLLIKQHPVLRFVRHVLVDEFQDTNSVQLDLVYEFSKYAKHLSEDASFGVTVVGDPDQSIYAFRNAQAINFQLMRNHYKDIKIVNLCENYRSTSGILLFSEKLMQQQTENRLSKDLKSQFSETFGPIYQDDLSSQQTEATWIASQIKYILKLPGHPFKASDISILLRASSQSRLIENELVRNRIGYTMLRGRAFWERKEVVAILNYLRAVANPDDRVAYINTINFPKRGIGAKSLEDIDAEITIASASMRLLSTHDVLKKISSGDISTKLLNKVLKSLQSYILLIEKFRSKIPNTDNITDTFLKEEFFNGLVLESGLKAEFTTESQEADSNINELLQLFSEFSGVEEEELPSQLEVDNRNYLEQYLHSVTLYETEFETDSDNLKLSICTIHGSKGLEWPIVFIPGVSEGVLPSRGAIRDNDPKLFDEERRIFYVALTRAKILLYISSYTEEVPRWEGAPVATTSRFLTKALGSQTQDLQSAFGTEEKLRKLYRLIGNPEPDIEELKPFIDKYYSLFSGSVEKGSGFQKVDIDMEVRQAKKFDNNYGKLNHMKRNISTGLETKKQRKLEDMFQRNTLGMKPKPQLSTVVSLDLSLDLSQPVVLKAPAYIPVRKIPVSLKKVRKLHDIRR